ncbi:hypothetical protein RHGRI_006069 [Rhododendron griersonianum]|uniref:Uncharacterized protein n=1 Tax=Rhododendron griersonianum TaxID=479676 RepID=A0AAV6LFQ4_9ERIC|nr:hypothetical protein RHGRI_006069 [Rhododendron griersonianum]
MFCTMNHDMSRSTSNRHGIFQKLCPISSLMHQSCYPGLNTRLLSVSSITRRLL